ncbi:unnamed protein product [Ectocarpus sp. 4 AP-2014]
MISKMSAYSPHPLTLLLLCGFSKPLFSREIHLSLSVISLCFSSFFLISNDQVLLLFGLFLRTQSQASRRTKSPAAQEVSKYAALQLYMTRTGSHAALYLNFACDVKIVHNRVLCLLCTSVVIAA